MNKIIIFSLTLIMTNICNASINIEKNLDNLSWVWSDTSRPRRKPAYRRYFRKIINIPENAKVKDAFVIFSCVKKGKFYLNGKMYKESNNANETAIFSFGSNVHNGKNIAAFEIGSSGKRSGVIGKIVIILENGKNIIIPLDEKWKVSKRDTIGWNNIKFNDSRWKNAVAIGTYGCKPWGIILSSNDDDDFPVFTVPGYTKEMNSLRNLFKLHYKPRGLLANIWDKWLVQSMLWPAMSDSQSLSVRGNFSRDFLKKKILDDGYINTDQHRGLGHPSGWPFPHWLQNGGIGWHFSLADSPAKSWGVPIHESTAGFVFNGIKELSLTPERGLSVKFTKNNGSVETPEFKIKALVSPLVRLEWINGTLDEKARPYIQWKTAKDNEYSAERKVYFDDIKNAVKRGEVICSIADLSKCKAYDVKDTITRYKISFDNKTGDEIVIVAISAAVDTRHNINNSVYTSAACDYFWWTGDVDFLRTNIEKMRKAFRYAITEFQVVSNKCIFTPWIGHDGRSGLVYKNGKKTIRHGIGIGNNYWDLMPFGGYDTLATIYFYDAARNMSKLEHEISRNPEWKIPDSKYKISYKKLAKLSSAVKTSSGKRFWNEKDGRFVAAVDVDNKPHDYGYTFLNCEAIYYGLAKKEQAKEIMDWISGKRLVNSDSSKGEDIYCWRFAPRATTKRNIDYYSYAWSAPESIPFGGQVQDGGAVLGFSFHDLMARLKVYGPDDAWKRLKEIIKWFDDVQNEGGYRKYYDKEKKRGTLQGGGTAGGLGLDHEFFESVLVPQVMIYGFLGFEPLSDGFKISPKLPKDWPAVRISNIRFHDQVLDITAGLDEITTETKGPETDELIFLPNGKWKIYYKDESGKIIKTINVSGKNVKKGIPIKTGNSRFTVARKLAEKG